MTTARLCMGYDAYSGAAALSRFFFFFLFFFYEQLIFLSQPPSVFGVLGYLYLPTYLPRD